MGRDRKGMDTEEFNDLSLEEMVDYFDSREVISRGRIAKLIVKIAENVVEIDKKLDRIIKR